MFSGCPSVCAYVRMYVHACPSAGIYQLATTSSFHFACMKIMTGKDGLVEVSFSGSLLVSIS